MNAVRATEFAREWVSAWNAHDLDRILSHYADDIVFLSPVAQKRMGDGRVVGVEALRKYWAIGLTSQPNLRFELKQTLAGHDTVTLIYRNHRGQDAAETLEFNASGKAVRSYACYTEEG